MKNSERLQELELDNTFLAQGKDTIHPCPRGRRARSDTIFEDEPDAASPGNGHCVTPTPKPRPRPTKRHKRSTTSSDNTVPALPSTPTGPSPLNSAIPALAHTTSRPANFVQAATAPPEPEHDLPPNCAPTLPPHEPTPTPPLPIPSPKPAPILAPHALLAQNIRTPSRNTQTTISPLVINLSDALQWLQEHYERLSAVIIPPDMYSLWNSVLSSWVELKRALDFESMVS